jgi:hypothetical protein
MEVCELSITNNLCYRVLPYEAQETCRNGSNVWRLLLHSETKRKKESYKFGDQTVERDALPCSVGMLRW